MPQLDDEYVKAIEVENEQLRERVWQLEEICGMALNAPLELGLTPNEARLFGLLYKSELVTKAGAMVALYSDRPNEEPEIKIIDVFICKVRKKIERFGIEIETIWGLGYRMSPAAKAVAKKIMDTQEQEVA